jgi:hypothetical protein
LLQYSHFSLILGVCGSMPRLIAAIADDNPHEGTGGLAGLTADLVLWQMANTLGIVWEAARTAVKGTR